MARSATVQIILRAKDMASGALGKVRGGVQGLDNTFQGFKNRIMSVQGALASLGIALSVGGVLKYVIDANRKFQDLRAILKTLEGSEEGALRVFEKIKEFAKETPYEVEDITNAVARLKGAGLALSDELMTAFADLTALKPEKTITDFAMAVEDVLSGSSMERLLEFGIRIERAGDKFVGVFRGQRVVMDQTTEAVEKYLMSLGQLEGVQGVSAERMNTLNGQASMLLDNLFQVALVIGEEGGLNQELSNANEWLVDLTDRMRENASLTAAWTKLVLNLGKALFHTFSAPIRVLFNVGNLIGRVLSVILMEFNNFIMEMAYQAVRGSNWVTEKLNKLPGVNFALTDTSGLKAQADAWREAATAGWKELGPLMVGDLKDIGSAVAGLGGSYGDLAESIARVGEEHAKMAAREGDWGKNRERTKQEDKDKKLTKAEEKRLAKLDEWDPFSGGKKWMGAPGGKGTIPLGPDGKPLDKLGYASSRREGPDMGEKIGASLAQMVDPAWALNDVIADGLTQSMYGFGDAVSFAFQQMVEGSMSAGEAFAGAMLASLGQVARGFGDFFMGQATGALAEGFLNKDPAAFASAAQFTAAAGMMYALSGALAGAASKNSGNGGSGSRASYKEDAAGELGSSQAEATLVIQGGLLDMSDPRQAAALADAIENLSGRRVIIQGDR